MTNNKLLALEARTLYYFSIFHFQKYENYFVYSQVGRLLAFRLWGVRSRWQKLYSYLNYKFILQDETTNSLKKCNIEVFWIFVEARKFCFDNFIVFTIFNWNFFVERNFNQKSRNEKKVPKILHFQKIENTLVSYVFSISFLLSCTFFIFINYYQVGPFLRTMGCLESQLESLRISLVKVTCLFQNYETPKYQFLMHL